MPYYVIYCKSHHTAQREIRRVVRQAHGAYLKTLDLEGRLLVAGALLDEDRSEMTLEGIRGDLIIAEFQSLQKAREWIAADPYMTAGVYSGVEIFPFRVNVLPPADEACS